MYLHDTGLYLSPILEQIIVPDEVEPRVHSG